MDADDEGYDPTGVDPTVVVAGAGVAVALASSEVDAAVGPRVAVGCTDVTDVSDVGPSASAGSKTGVGAAARPRRIVRSAGVGPTVAVDSPNVVVGPTAFADSPKVDVEVQTDIVMCDASGSGVGVDSGRCSCTDVAVVMPLTWFGSYDIFNHVSIARRPRAVFVSCRNLIDELTGADPQVFMIGITGNPHRRWFGSDNSEAQPYFHDWNRMDLIHCTQTVEGAKLLEVFLIETVLTHMAVATLTVVTGVALEIRVWSLDSFGYMWCRLL